jgi:hypothetical protein
VQLAGLITVPQARGVNPTDPTPAYLQIANDLRAAIEDGALPHGAQLPSLRAMERITERPVAPCAGRSTSSQPRG